MLIELLKFQSVSNCYKTHHAKHEIDKMFLTSPKKNTIGLSVTEGWT